VVEHVLDGIRVPLALIVKLLGFALKFCKSPLGVDIDRILGLLAKVELLLEVLRRLCVVKPMSTNIDPFHPAGLVIMPLRRPASGGVDLPGQWPWLDL
jgi:hypothetical protein